MAGGNSESRLGDSSEATSFKKRLSSSAVPYKAKQSADVERSAKAEFVKLLDLREIRAIEPIFSVNLKYSLATSSNGQSKTHWVIQHGWGTVSFLRQPQV